MTTTPDDERLARVARVTGELPAGAAEDWTFGSGYRISARLVLTAHHLLKNASNVTADLGGDGVYRPVTCVWWNEDLDLALLRFDAVPTLVLGATPVRLGTVSRAAGWEVSARAVGHPKWAEVDRSSLEPPEALWRGRAAVRCVIRTADVEAPGMLRVTVTDAAPAPVPASAPPELSPWNGMSGAGVWTEEAGLLVAVVREHFEAAGVGTLQVTALDRVQDEGWRQALRDEGVDPRPLPALPDGWDRTARQSLEPHHTSRDGMPRTPEEPSYVDPGGAGSPAAVLARLAELADQPRLPAGLIVVGEPGSGKSRLCQETAALAEDSREWLVIHLTDAQPLTDVWRSVRGLADRVLVVADNIDWIADPGATYSTVFAEAAGADVRLAMLTSARRQQLDDLADSPLNPYTTFDTVDIRWDPQLHRAVSRAMVRSLAGEAFKQLAEERLVELCPGPPAVSRLYATYYGNEAAEGHDLTGAEARPYREFGNWLHPILLALGLPAQTEDDEPARATMAVARLVVHASRSLGEEQVLDLFAEDREDPHRRAGRKILKRLVAYGLLERRDDTVRPAHDVYADRLLGRAVLLAGGQRVHVEALHQLLGTGLADGRALVRVVTAVDRLCLTLDDAVGGPLAGAVRAWCDQHRDRIEALVLGNPRGAELRALLRRRTWRPFAVGELAEPWLWAHATRAEAGDTLLTAVRHLPSEVGHRYLSGWIYQHGHRPDAAHALHQALAEQRDPDTQEWTTDQAYEWLTDNAQRVSASRPLAQLLNAAKGGVPHGDPRAKQLLTWALRWLRRYPGLPNTSFVARSLIRRPDLTGADLAWTARLLLDTVGPGDPPKATFALEAVLVRQREHRDLTPGVYEQAVRDAFDWLKDENGYGLRPAAAYLLKELVNDRLPGRDALPRAVQAAWNWLKFPPNAGHHTEQGKVLPSLLKNAVKSSPRQYAAFVPEEQAELGDMAVAWLRDRQGASWDSVSEVLGALLRTPLYDGDPERLRWLADTALALLGERPNPSVARSVLVPLLHKRYADGDLRDRVVAATFAQLPPQAPPNAHLAFPLTELMRRTDLDEDEYGRAITGTLAWLDQYPRHRAAAGLLARALANHRATDADRARLATRAIAALDPRTLLKGGYRRTETELVAMLPRHRAGMRTEWNRFVALACERAAAREELPYDAGRVLAGLLKGADELDEPALARLHAVCLDWCEAHDRAELSRKLLVRVLDGDAPSPAVRGRATRAALAWLDRPGTARNSADGQLMAALLKGGAMPDAAVEGRVLDVALDWLDVHTGGHRFVDPLLAQVARRLAHLPGGQRTDARLRRARDRLGHRLEGHPAPESEAYAALAEHRRRLAGLLDAGEA